jgi:hypothetical protein
MVMPLWEFKNLNKYGNIRKPLQAMLEFHSLVGKIDPNKPFHMVVDFNEDYTNMIITLSQDGNSVKVFDMTEPKYPYTPSDLDMSKLKRCYECWLVVYPIIP